MTDSKQSVEPQGTEESLRARLRALAVDAPDSAFRAGLHRRLVAEPIPAKVGPAEHIAAWLGQRRAWLWPAGGLATGVAVYVLLAALHGNPLAPVVAPNPGIASSGAESSPAMGSVLPSFRVPSSRVAIIKLAFAAEVAVEDVTFEVKLPEGLAFWSGGQRLAERTFRWPGRLEAGENLIPIAVRGDRPGRYPVVATVEVDGRVLEHRVVMEVTAEGT